MDNNMEIVETATNEVTNEVTTDNDGKKSGIELKDALLIGAGIGLVAGAGSEVGKKAVDGLCQLGYNIYRTAQDKLEEGKEERARKKEEKKAEREKRYQEEKKSKENK